MKEIFFDNLENIEIYYLSEIDKNKFKKPTLSWEEFTGNVFLKGYKEFLGYIDDKEIWVYYELNFSPRYLVIEGNSGEDLTKPYVSFSFGLENWAIYGDILKGKVLSEIRDKFSNLEEKDEDGLPDEKKAYRCIINYNLNDFIKKIKDWSSITEKELRDYADKFLEKERVKCLKRIDKEIKKDKKKKNIKINGKELKGRGYTFKFDKELNKIFSNIDFLYEIFSYNGNLNQFENFFIQKKISYEYNEGKRKYKISFDGEKVFIDGVIIPKNKITFFVLRANGEEDRIKLLKKLSGRAFQILEIEEVYLNYGYATNGWDYKKETITIPLTTETDGVNWKVNFMNKSYPINYEDLQKFFFDKRSLTIEPCVKFREMEKLLNVLGIDKKEFFEYIKKIKILGALENENN